MVYIEPEPAPDRDHLVLAEPFEDFFTREYRPVAGLAFQSEHAENARRSPSGWSDESRICSHPVR